MNKGISSIINDVDLEMPRIVNWNRMVAEIEWEEFFEYNVPDDEDEASGSLKILEMAAKWKAQYQKGVEDSDSYSSDVDH